MEDGRRLSGRIDIYERSQSFAWTEVLNHTLRFVVKNSRSQRRLIFVHVHAKRVVSGTLPLVPFPCHTGLTYSIISIAFIWLGYTIRDVSDELDSLEFLPRISVVCVR
jgi:hypothetical protein